VHFEKFNNKIAFFANLCHCWVDLMMDSFECFFNGSLLIDKHEHYFIKFSCLCKDTDLGDGSGISVVKK
jgi:hypothetical protein